MPDEKCSEQASVRVLWPGREPMLMCVDHATTAKKIAGVMGCYVHMEPIFGINACQCVKEASDADCV